MAPSIRQHIYDVTPETVAADLRFARGNPKQWGAYAKELRGKYRKGGGVGIYINTDFVHVDNRTYSGRLVRAEMPRRADRRSTPTGPNGPERREPMSEKETTETEAPEPEEPAEEETNGEEEERRRVNGEVALWAGVAAFFGSLIASGIFDVLRLRRVGELPGSVPGGRDHRRSRLRRRAVQGGEAGAAGDAEAELAQGQSPEEGWDLREVPSQISIDYASTVSRRYLLTRRILEP